MAGFLLYDDAMAGYDLGSAHPLKPERFTLTVELMRAYGLLAECVSEPTAESASQPTAECVSEPTAESVSQPTAEGASGLSAAASDPGSNRLVVRRPHPAPDEDLALVHDRAYIDTVKAASAEPERFTWRSKRGIGPGDTPAAPGLHDAAALIAGATTQALELVLGSEPPARAFAVAGGLHHAHRDYASGFCIYNDPAIAIAVALRDGRVARVAYLDIDAHHGDGVQEAFYASPDVLTISLHESGRYLFPGTGRERETGRGEGEGYAINVPLPPLANNACYQLAFDEVVAPALAAYRPDVLIAQCGADAHHADPLTHLGLTLTDMRSLYRRIVSLAEEHCGGRLVCTGGGGYGTFSVVPRAWTMLAAELAEVELPEELPGPWRERAAALAEAAGGAAMGAGAGGLGAGGLGASDAGAGGLGASDAGAGPSAPRTLTEDTVPPGDPVPLLEETRAVVARVRESSPLLD